MKRKLLHLSTITILATVVGCGFVNQAKQKIRCDSCAGKGLCRPCGGDGKGWFNIKCKVCEGKGRCVPCKGVGYTLKQKK